jgi:hypothetical protein
LNSRIAVTLWYPERVIYEALLITISSKLRDPDSRAVDRRAQEQFAVMEPKELKPADQKVQAALFFILTCGFVTGLVSHN